MMGEFYQLIIFLCAVGEVVGIVPLTSSAKDGRLFKHSPNGELESQCQVELKQLFDKNSSFTNTLAFDATGKLPSGVLVGNWASLGHFDECQSLVGFKYCSADLHISVNETETLQLLSSVLRWGLCIPQSCSEEDVATSLVYFFDLFDKFPIENIDLKQVLVNCAHDPVKPYDGGFYCCIFLCCSLISLMFASGIFDEYSKFKVRCDHASDRTKVVTEDEAFLLKEEAVPLRPTENIPDNTQQSFLNRMFVCFAINRNLVKLLSTAQPKKNIQCLNGIRVLSMFWIIFGHTNSFMFTTLIVDNPSRVWQAVSSFWMQVAANAFPAVDTFFFLSGLLVSYLTLQKLERTGGRLPFLSFYLHRILRILPSYMFIILLFIFIVPYMSEGPIWFKLVHEDSCRQYWWTNLLFINNFYPVSFLSQCMDWAWYLANDMQFYLISPFLLLLLHRCKFLGVSLAAILCCVCIATTGVLMGVNEFSNGFQGFVDRRSHGEDYLSVVYGKPYCRITPYLIGLLLGYGMSRLKVNNQHVKLSSIVMVLGWILSCTLMILVVFGLYGSYHGDPMTVLASVLYESLSRFTWAVALSWVVFACFYGYGGWVNQLLSSALWVPLSRLVFIAYLIHPIMIKVFIFSTFAPLHYSYTSMVFYYFAYVLSSFTVAVVIFLVVELPFANLVGLATTNKYQKEDAGTDEASTRRKQCDEQV